MVYQPQPEEIPAYEEYADPATAHGWQNTYDETRELPAVAASPRRSRRKPSPWRQRRVAVAAGAVGAVSAAALVAGFAFSGSSSSGGAQSEKGRTGPTAGDTDAVPEESADARTGGERTASAPAAAGTGAGGSAPTANPSGDAAAPTAPTASPTSAAAAPVSTPAAPATSAPVAPGDGDGDDKPGRGQGKGPR